jgi:hypothetical protein
MRETAVNEKARGEMVRLLYLFLTAKPSGCTLPARGKTMTPRERVKAVFEGRTPDQVPLMLDLSHWYKKNNNVFFDLGGFKEVESGLVELHKRVNAVCYVEMGPSTAFQLTILIFALRYRKTTESSRPGSAPR